MARRRRSIIITTRLPSTAAVGIVIVAVVVLAGAACTALILKIVCRIVGIVIVLTPPIGLAHLTLRPGVKNLPTRGSKSLVDIVAIVAIE
tara:strand:- start:573 stop:842 length:270 start_codon:yes stop_codon:yes gene_type:complete|eukprot:scaffold127435_cov57-Phaeocystis_antarctica.AAC.1